MNDNDIRSFASQKSRIAEARLHHARKFSRRVLPCGTRLETLEIVEPLAENGLDIVYLVIDHACGQYRVVKEYLPARLAARLPDGQVAAFSHAEMPRFDAGRASFLSEARILAQHDSPFLVKAHRTWEANGTAYVLMPCLHGMSLRQAFEEYLVIPTQEWLQDFLADLHAAMRSPSKLPGFRIHLSPGRIFLPQDERPLLLGLGASRQAVGEVDSGFAPPELYAGADVSLQGEWTDVYTLGAIAYYLIAARAPLAASERRQQGAMPSAREAGKDRYSAWLLEAVDRALALEASQRHASLAEFCRAMRLPLPKPRATPPIADMPAPEASVVTVPMTTATASPMPPVAGLTVPAAQRREPPRVAASAVPESQTPVTVTAQRTQTSPIAAAFVSPPPSHQGPIPAPPFSQPRETGLRTQPREADLRIEPTLEPTLQPVASRPVRSPVHQPMRYRKRRSGLVWATLTVLFGAGLGTAAYLGQDRWMPAVERPAPTVVLGKPAQALSASGEAEDLAVRQVAETPVRMAIPKPEPEPEPKPEPRVAAATPPHPAPVPPPSKVQQESPKPVAALPSRGMHRQSGASPTFSASAGAEPPTQVAALESATPAEETAWKTATAIDKPPAYESYLHQYPAGRHAAAARDKLATSRLTEEVIRTPVQEVIAAPSSPAPATGGAPAPVDRTSSSRVQDPALSRNSSAGHVIKLDGQTMTGNFTVDQKTGIISGTGRISWNNGNQFDGTLVRGVKQGKGQFIWNNGQRYSGDWANDMPNGHGTMIFPNGNRYEGSMRDGKPNGKGMLVFANGNRYEGDIVDGLPQGKGTLRFQTGDVYQGAWSGGKIQGDGRYTWKSGNVWEGEFRNDRMTSNGKMIYSDASGPIQASQ